MPHVKGLGVLILILVMAIVMTMISVDDLRRSHNKLIERVEQLEKALECPHRCPQSERRSSP